MLIRLKTERNRPAIDFELLLERTQNVMERMIILSFKKTKIKGLIVQIFQEHITFFEIFHNR